MKIYENMKTLKILVPFILFLFVFLFIHVDFFQLLKKKTKIRFR